MKRLLILLALSACAQQPDVTVPKLVMAPKLPPRPFLRDAIPSSAMNCASEPSGAAVKTIRQSAVYILDLKSAGRDCRQKLGGVRSMILNEK